MAARPHDTLFKWTFSRPEHAASLLRGVLPPAAAQAIDWSALCLEPGSFVRPGLVDRYSDLLFSARLHGEAALLYVLVEHQSSSDEDMPRRMLTYVVRIWERYRREHPRGPIPLVVPLVVTHDPRGWSAPRSLHEQVAPDPTALDGLAAHVPALDVLIFDLSKVSDDDLRARVLGALPRLTLALLRDGRDDGRLLADLQDWASTVRELLRAQTGARAVLVLLEYIAHVSNLPIDQIHATIQRHIPEAEPIAMTLAEQLRQEGRQQGRQEGRQEGRQQGREEGRQQGQAALLLRQLSLKFGPLDARRVEQVESASEAELEHLSARVLEAHSLDEVFERFETPS